MSTALTLAASELPAIASLPSQGSGPQDQVWAWFGGTSWKEGRAVYEVEAKPRYMKWRADFIVTKVIFSRKSFMPVYIDNTRGVLVYGHTGKWYSKEATPYQITWVESCGRRVANIWNRLRYGDGWFAVFRQEAHLVRTAEEFARNQARMVHGESDLFLDEPAATLTPLAADMGTDHPGVAATTRWTQYQDSSKRRWWYRDDLWWFFEDDPAWERYLEPDSRRFYWRNPDSPEVCFYEDTGSMF